MKSKIIFIAYTLSTVFLMFVLFVQSIFSGSAFFGEEAPANRIQAGAIYSMAFVGTIIIYIASVIWRKKVQRLWVLFTLFLVLSVGMTFLAEMYMNNSFSVARTFPSWLSLGIGLPYYQLVLISSAAFVAYIYSRKSLTK